MLADEDAWVIRALLELKYGRINKIWDRSMLFDEDQDEVSDDELLDETYDWSNPVKLIKMHEDDSFTILQFFFDVKEPLPPRGGSSQWRKYLRKFINEKKFSGDIKKDASVYVMVTSIDHKHIGDVFYVAEHPKGRYEEFQYYGATEHLDRFIEAGMVRKLPKGEHEKHDRLYGRTAVQHPTYEEFLAKMGIKLPR